MTPPLVVAFVDLCEALQAPRTPIAADVPEDQAHIGPFAFAAFRHRFNIGRSIFQLLPTPTGVHPQSGWNNRQIEAVCAVFESLRAIDHKLEVIAAFNKAKKGSTSRTEGAKALEEVLNDLFYRKASRLVDTLLDNRGLGFDGLVSNFGEMPTQEVVNFGRCSHELALALFGSEGLTNNDINSQFAKLELGHFIAWLWSRTRQRYAQRWISREAAAKRALDALTATWADFERMNKISRKDLSRFLRRSAELVESVATKRLKTNVEFISVWQRRFEGVRKIYGLSATGTSTVDLPNSLTAALAFIRTEAVDPAEHDEIVHHLNYVADIDPSQRSVDIEADAPYTRLAQHRAYLDGPTGAERWEALDVDVFRRDVFGLPTGSVLAIGLNSHLAADDTVMIHPRDPGWQDELAASPQKFRVLEMDRVQWNGAAALLSAFMAGLAMLVTDEVGTGKTGQLLLTLLWLTHFRVSYATKGRFPGVEHANAVWPQLAHRSRISPGPPLPAPGNIPDLPFIIGVPHSLQNQWMHEIYKFVNESTLAALPYPSMSPEARLHFWRTVYPDLCRRMGGPGRVIIVASYPALVRDYMEAYTQAPEDQRNYVRGDAAPVNRNIYGHRYSACVFDEIHCARKSSSSLYHALRALVYLSDARAGMTATPVFTSPGDLWDIGQLLVVPGFVTAFDNLHAEEMRKELNRAQTSSRRERDTGEGSAASTLLRELMRTAAEDDDEDDAPDETILLMESQTASLRERFVKGGRVLRRVPELDIPPHRDVIIRAEPSKYELAKIAKIEEEYAEARKKVFYAYLRKALTHPRLGEVSEDWPDNREEFHQYPSTKLDITVQLAAKYDDFNTELAKWRARIKPAAANALKSIASATEDDFKTDPPPNIGVYTWDESKREIVPDSEEPLPPQPLSVRTRPVKTVIYAHFVMLHSVIMKVLSAFGIPVLAIYGTMSAAQRSAIIEEFKHSAVYHVLIMSDIGIAGLNLQFAVVLIILELVWSAQEDRQMLGRLLRRGQHANVMIYRIVLLRTADIILNNMSYVKQAMMKGFVGNEDADEYSALFRNEYQEASEPEDDEVEQLSDVSKRLPVRRPRATATTRSQRSTSTRHASSSRTASRRAASTTTTLDHAAHAEHAEAVYDPAQVLKLLTDEWTRLDDPLIKNEICLLGARIPTAMLAEINGHLAVRLVRLAYLPHDEVDVNEEPSDALVAACRARLLDARAAREEWRLRLGHATARAPPAQTRATSPEPSDAAEVSLARRPPPSSSSGQTPSESSSFPAAFPSSSSSSGREDSWVDDVDQSGGRVDDTKSVHDLLSDAASTSPARTVFSSIRLPPAQAPSDEEQPTLSPPRFDMVDNMDYTLDSDANPQSTDYTLDFAATQPPTGWRSSSPDRRASTSAQIDWDTGNISLPDFAPSADHHSKPRVSSRRAPPDPARSGDRLAEKKKRMSLARSANLDRYAVARPPTL